MLDRLAIEFITVLGMPPVEFVHLAADLGCRRVGLALAPFTGNPRGYPAWSLRDDPALRRELTAALRERGVAISLGEGFLIRPSLDIRDAAADIELMAELGAERVNVVAIDPDRGRGLDQLATFAAMARALGLVATLEFMPMSAFPTLASGLAAVGEIGRDDLQLVVDCMHLVRSGGTPAELAAADAAAIGYLQLCDVPSTPSPLGYAEEGKHHRLPPGEGELPLAEILASTPPHVPIGLEVPQLSIAQQGVQPREQLEHLVQAAATLIKQSWQTDS
jgi:sugar phosphate isomerase/epimerase